MLYFTLTIDINECWGGGGGVDHDEIILLSTPFLTIPMLDTNCCCNVILFYLGNKRCCIVLRYVPFCVGVNLLHEPSYCNFLIVTSLLQAGERGDSTRPDTLPRGDPQDLPQVVEWHPGCVSQHEKEGSSSYNLLLWLPLPTQLHVSHPPTATRPSMSCRAYLFPSILCAFYRRLDVKFFSFFNDP